jgi:hypothetical protein
MPVPAENQFQITQSVFSYYTSRPLWAAVQGLIRPTPYTYILHKCILTSYAELKKCTFFKIKSIKTLCSVIYVALNSKICEDTISNSGCTYCDVLHHAEIVFPPCCAEERRRKPKEAEVSRANKREECLYFVAPQWLATHVTRLAQQ